MRDRREVLKLLAGGTAVAAGASLVTTSTAFAFGGTASCRPNGESGALPTVSLGTTTAVRVGTGNTVSGIEFRINNQTSLTPAAATCSTCHPGVTPTASIQYRWSLDNQGGAAGTYGFFDAANGGSEVTAFRAAPIPGSIFLRRTDAGGPAFPSTANTNLDYTVRLTIR